MVCWTFGELMLSTSYLKTVKAVDTRLCFGRFVRGLFGSNVEKYSKQRACSYQD